MGDQICRQCLRCGCTANIQSTNSGFTFSFVNSAQFLTAAQHRKVFRNLTVTLWTLCQVMISNLEVITICIQLRLFFCTLLELELKSQFSIEIFFRDSAAWDLTVLNYFAYHLQALLQHTLLFCELKDWLSLPCLFFSCCREPLPLWARDLSLLEPVWLCDWWEPEWCRDVQ